MKKDRYLVAAVLGMVSTIVAELFSLLLVAIGLSDQDMFRIDSVIYTGNRPDFFFGMLADFIAGGAVAALFLYLLERFGARNIIIKGVMISLFSWFVFRMYSIAFIEGRFIDLRPLEQYYLKVLCAVVNGFVLGLLFRLVLFRRTGEDA